MRKASPMTATTSAPAAGVRGDREVGAFRGGGPWLVDPSSMPWRQDVDTLRRDAIASVEHKLRKRALPGLRGVRVLLTVGVILGPWLRRFRKRRKQAKAEAMAAAAYSATAPSGGSHEVEVGAGANQIEVDLLNPFAGLVDDEQMAELAVRMRKAFERLGPTYIKLGQFLSAAEGVVPDSVVEQFKACQDRVPPVRFSAVKRMVERDLGRPLNEIFAEFDTEPLAAASIAQVHAARLVTGEAVVVKVQRPAIARLVFKDVRVMAWGTRLLVKFVKPALLANPQAFVELFTETLVEELDFRIEAQNLLDVAGMLVKIGRDDIVCPRPHPELVSRRVMVMERIDGRRMDDLASFDDRAIAESLAAEAALRGDDVDRSKASAIEKVVFRALFSSFFEGAVTHGIFHADLHAGNAAITPDGQAVLYDFGITGRFSEEGRVGLMRLIMSLFTGDHDAQLKALIELGAFSRTMTLDELREKMEGTPLFNFQVTVTHAENLPVDVSGVGDAADDDGDDDKGEAPEPVAEATEPVPVEQLAGKAIHADNAAMQNGLARLLELGVHLPKDVIFFLKGFIYMMGAVNRVLGDLGPAAVKEEMTSLFFSFWRNNSDAFVEILGLDPSTLGASFTALTQAATAAKPIVVTAPAEATQPDHADPADPGGAPAPVVVAATPDDASDEITLDKA